MFQIQRYATPAEFHGTLTDAMRRSHEHTHDDRLWVLCLWYVNQEHLLNMDLALKLKELYDSAFFHERSALRSLMPMSKHSFPKDDFLDVPDSEFKLPSIISYPKTESTRFSYQIRLACYIWRNNSELLCLINGLNLLDDWMHHAKIIHSTPKQAESEPPRLPNFAAGGHILIIGAARTGKTTLSRHILPKESIQEWDFKAIKQEISNDRRDPQIWFEIHEGQPINDNFNFDYVYEQGPSKRVFILAHRRCVTLTERADWFIFTDRVQAREFLIHGRSQFLMRADQMRPYEFMVYESKTGRVTFHEPVPFPTAAKECRAAVGMRQALQARGCNQQYIQELIDYFFF